MEQVTKLMNLQEDRIEQMQKAQTNYLKSLESRITSSYVETRLKSLERMYCSFNKVHEEILSLILRSNRRPFEYFSLDKNGVLEELYTSYKSSLKEKLKELTSEKTLSDTHSPSRSSTNTEIKLPTIQIPTFSGKYTDWPSFRDLFISIIHKNTTLDDVQKLHYLKSLVTGDAEQLLRSVSITNDNYTQAWETMYKRFNNKRYIVYSIFKKLFGIKTLAQESAHLLKQLLDTTRECLSSLNNNGVKTETWDDIVVYITVSKLDPISRRLWEQHISAKGDEMPSLQHLSQFLEMRFKSLEMVDDYTRPCSKSKTFHCTAPVSAVKCTFCKGEHYIFNCKRFVRQSRDSRIDFVKANRLCFNCLIPNHSAKVCLRSTCCNICKRKHHSLLHPGKKETQITTEQQQRHENKHIDTYYVTQPGQVLLPTALVDVSGRNGNAHLYRALLDQGSQASFVTEDLVKSAGLKKIMINSEVTGLSEEIKLRTKYVVELQLRSRIEPHFTMSVKAYVLKKITNNLPSQRCSITDWPELESIALADPTFNETNKIDILLGAEVYAKILDEGLLKSSAEMIAQKTKLGWILSGKPVDTLHEALNPVTNIHICDSKNTL